MTSTINMRCLNTAHGKVRNFKFRHSNKAFSISNICLKLSLHCDYWTLDRTRKIRVKYVRYFGWPQVSQTVREKPLPCVSLFASDQEANTKPIGLGPLPTTSLYKRGSPLGDLNQSNYRVSTETFPIRLVRALKGSEARVPTAGATGVDQKATAAEEMPLDFADRCHRLHHLYTDSDRRDGFLHCQY
jgi:hypothetical protein